jgi:hypothetical protein
MLGRHGDLAERILLDALSRHDPLPPQAAPRSAAMLHPLMPANAGIQFHWLSSNISLVSRFRGKERS